MTRPQAVTAEISPIRDQSLIACSHKSKLNVPEPKVEIMAALVRYSDRKAAFRNRSTSRLCMPPARIGNMSQDYQNSPFSMLPYRRPPWREFALIMGVQAIAVFILAWAGVLNLGVLPSPVHDYHFIRLVDTPPPINLEPGSGAGDSCHPGSAHRNPVAGCPSAAATCGPTEASPCGCTSCPHHRNRSPQNGCSSADRWR